ncbi:hypothetical protein [Bifidobacterium santillanense]|nr:hypothetical protein [Bifidobacterium santillanense]
MMMALFMGLTDTADVAVKEAGRHAYAGEDMTDMTVAVVHMSR